MALAGQVAALVGFPAAGYLARMKATMLLSETLRAAREGLPEGLVLIVAGGLIPVLAGFGPAGTVAAALLVLLTLATTCRAMTGEALPGALALAPAGQMTVSLLLTASVLGFFAILTIMAGALVTLAIMAGSGFDFETAAGGEAAFEQVFASYQATPGWQLAQAAFLVALFVWFVALARALPVPAASAVQARVLALEGFNATRGQGLKLLAALICVQIVPLAMVVAGQSHGSGTVGMASAAIGSGLGLFGLAALSMASYRLLGPPDRKLQQTA